METYQPTFFDIAFWAILLIGIAGLGLYGLVNFWQNSARNDLNDARSQARQSKHESQLLKTYTQIYSVSDPEPFGSLASSFQEQLDRIDENIRQVLGHYARIKEDIHKIPASEVKSLPLRPMAWYRIYKDTNQLAQEQQALSDIISAAYSTQQKLVKQGWEVARLARQALQDGLHANQILSSLVTRDIQDPLLDQQKRQVVDWQQTLNTRIPLYFLSAREAEALAQVSKEEIAYVYHLVGEAQPSLSEILFQAKSWEAETQELEKLIPQAASSVEKVGSELTALENSPEYPIHWDINRDKLAILQSNMSAIGTEPKARNLDQIKKELAGIREIQESILELSRVVEEIGGQRQVFSDLLKNPELEQGNEWCRAAQKLVGQLAPYDPENWPWANALEKLKSDLQSLSGRQQRLKTENQGSALKESRLVQILEDAHQLLALHQRLRPQVGNLQTRFVEIKGVEREARVSLSRLRALLNQTEMLVGANPLLTNAAAAKIDGVQQELEGLSLELDQPEQGTVEKKSRRVDNLVKSAERQINQWLDQLDSDLTTKKSKLGEMVSALNSVAVIEDAPVGEAQRLLSNSRDNRTAGRGSKSAGFPITEVVNELKRKNDEWQSCVAIFRALEDIEGPILDRYHNLEEQRQIAWEQLTTGQEIIPDSRSWPPTTQSLIAEQQEFNKLEQRWEALRRGQHQAIQLVSKLSNISEGYRELASRVRSTIERASQEQSRITELERRLEESRRLWEYQLQVYAGSLEIVENIQAMLAEVDRDVEAVQQRYKNRAILYNQALQTLRAICQKMDNAQVPFEDGQVLEISGEVVSRF